MKRFLLYFLPLLSVFSLCLCTGFACGAPTPYQRYNSEKKTDCEIDCAKAHSEKDISGRQTCLRVCDSKKEVEELKKQGE